MRLLIIFLFISAYSIAQGDGIDYEFDELPIEEKRKLVIKELLNDTLKFSQEDIYHTVSGTKNKNSYSPLFIINGKQ